MEADGETWAAPGSARLVRLAWRDSRRGRASGGKALPVSFVADYHRPLAPLIVRIRCSPASRALRRGGA